VPVKVWADYIIFPNPTIWRPYVHGPTLFNRCLCLVWIYPVIIHWFTRIIHTIDILLPNWSKECAFMPKLFNLL